MEKILFGWIPLVSSTTFSQSDKFDFDQRTFFSYNKLIFLSKNLNDLNILYPGSSANFKAFSPQ